MQLSTEINTRLATLVKHFTHGNAAAFARSIDVVQQRFDRLLKPDRKSGKYPMVKPEIVEVIMAQYPAINRIWLLSGAGPMLHDAQDPQTTSYGFSSYGVPYYPTDFIHALELVTQKHAESIGYYIDFKSFNHADFWCHITGRSMEPEIASGDIVAMKEVLDRENDILYGEIYGMVTKNFCTIRRVAKGNSDDQLILIPANKSAEYAEQEIPRAAVERLFQLLCCVKEL